MTRLAAGAIAVLAFAMASSSVLAEGMDSDPPAEITAEVSTVKVTEETLPVPQPVRCRWRPAPSSPNEADGMNVTFEVVFGAIGVLAGAEIEVPFTFYYEHQSLRMWSEPAQQFQVKMRADCSGATQPYDVAPGAIDWQTVDPPDPIIMLDEATDIATKPIDFPTPNINPPGRVPVNLGMWLAVDEAGPITATARLGPVWAQVRAEVATTTFDMGNGDVVTCDGFGTPIPDSAMDSVEQGPCGYTYLDIPADGDPTVTVTSTWSITWSLSNGATGAQPDIVVTADASYDVYEIQTVGTRN